MFVEEEDNSCKYKVGRDSKIQIYYFLKPSLHFLSPYLFYLFIYLQLQ